MPSTVVGAGNKAAKQKKSLSRARILLDVMCQIIVVAVQGSNYFLKMLFSLFLLYSSYVSLFSDQNPIMYPNPETQMLYPKFYLPYGTSYSNHVTCAVDFFPL